MSPDKISGNIGYQSGQLAGWEGRLPDKASRHTNTDGINIVTLHLLYSRLIVLGKGIFEHLKIGLFLFWFIAYHGKKIPKVWVFYEILFGYFENVLVSSKSSKSISDNMYTLRPKKT